MDELLIEDKKYVSSKRAAKMTGYAKDYIGQLCREGRVPARLVGRSWYVLETAIQDHRFGPIDVKSEEKDRIVEPEPVISHTWESPRYEASDDEFLPSINRLQTAEISSTDKNGENGENGENKESERLQNTWKEWFDHIANTETPTPVIEETKMEEDNVKEVNIPIHAVYKQPPKELLPHGIRHEFKVSNIDIDREQNKIFIAIQVCGVLFASIAISLAIISSGYLDEYIISNSQARIIAGIVLYDK